MVVCNGYARFRVTVSNVIAGPVALLTLPSPSRAALSVARPLSPWGPRDLAGGRNAAEFHPLHAFFGEVDPTS